MKDNRRGFLKKTGLVIAGLVGAGTAKNDNAIAAPTLTPTDQPDAFGDEVAHALLEIRDKRIGDIIARQDAKLRAHIERRNHAYIAGHDPIPMPEELKHGLRKEDSES